MDITDLGNLFFWRAAERLLGVMLGGMSIYLGYKLFLRMPTLSQEGEGKLDLPGGVSIYVSRVGPGIFFALFGAILLGFSFASPLRVATPAPVITATDSNTPQTAAPGGTSFSYISGGTDVAQLDSDRIAVIRDMRTLKQLEQALETGGSEGVTSLRQADADSILIALPRIKRLMLHSVWSDEWGDYQGFADWVRDGAMEPAPKGLERIAPLYRGEG